ncbi:MAG: FtsX-like permease family protein [Lachnospiraceae bacterium]|nr:FtsX-like permease family protein [Lachnospiraceae bacterium]
MLIRFKDAFKLIGISVVLGCAVLVCTMFLNFYLDVQAIQNEITSELSMIFYNAQVSTAKVVCLVSGGCLLITSVIMLLFYIRQYIEAHKKELGILKALGYSNLRIARSFWVFGMSALAGAAIGFAGAFLLMPQFYALQNEDKMLPEMMIQFHSSILLYLVGLPAVLLGVLSIGYAWYKLHQPVLQLLKNSGQSAVSPKKHRTPQKKALLFIEDLKKDTLRSKKALAFFMIFASFCFSAMTQMSFSMKDLSSEMMGVMMLIIGLVLAFTTLCLAVTTVIQGNIKTIAMMRVFGYSQKECCRAILGGYRPLSYIGFILGTGYQYALLRVMVDIVFKEVADMPAYQFDFPVMLVCFGVFAATYEFLMHLYAKRIKKVSIKEIMIE